MLDETTNLNSIYQLTHVDTKNWRKLLEFGETLELNDKRKILWIWPTEQNLMLFQCILQKFDINRILSIGCGNGLFEWILRESIGLSVYGLEVDKLWWQSRYAVKSFIELKYVDDIASLSSDFLKSCCYDENWTFALLFCYFNNREAFIDYLRIYKGKWLILIGPALQTYIHTDPNPLDPNFPIPTQWRLLEKFNIGEDAIVTIFDNLKI